jgi:hypothetical protein
VEEIPMSRLTAVLMSFALGVAGAARASDRWEYAAYNSWDDDSTTLNFLQHGTRQVQHDLEAVGGTADTDWYAFKQIPWHSYEVRVNGGIMYWGAACGTIPCPHVDLVNAAGAVVTPGSVTGDDALSTSPSLGRSMSLRWLFDGTSLSKFVRVGPGDIGTPGTGGSYDLSFRDTTYSVPRWNNSGTQASIFILQNTTVNGVSGLIYLFESVGTMAGSISYDLPPRGMVVLNTAAIPQLAGKSGSALIALETGGYGALTGKVVSVEASTGFTFDTPIAPIPY